MSSLNNDFISNIVSSGPNLKSDEDENSTYDYLANMWYTTNNNNSHNTTNINNITNNTINVQLVAYNKSDISHITDEELIKCLNSVN